MEKIYRVQMNKNGMPDFSTAEEVEPKHGEWKINNNGWAYCSECESLGLESYNFCPNCGTKMKGAGDD